MTLTKAIEQDGTYLVDENGVLHLQHMPTGYMVAKRAISGPEAATPGTLVGRWTDHFKVQYSYGLFDGEEVFWDEVEVIDNLLDAGNIARQRKELAIWDNLNNCEIRV